MRFTGIARPEEFRIVTRAHLIAWRDELRGRELGRATIRHRLAALASLFEYLCDKNAVTHNPVKGVERPRTESGEGKTPAIGDHQARKLLEAPQDDTIKSKRDRAIHAAVSCVASRGAVQAQGPGFSARAERRAASQGVRQRRQDALSAAASGDQRLINDYLDAAGHGTDDNGALFRPIRNNRTGRLELAITADGVYRLVRSYSAQLGFEIGAHALRATAAANALDHQADIAKGMAWPRQHRHHAYLRSPSNAARGRPDFQGCLSMRQPAQPNDKIIATMRACIEHARMLLESARAVQEAGHPNIACHLAGSGELICRLGHPEC
jgi:integrase/recombinase XerD